MEADRNNNYNNNNNSSRSNGNKSTQRVGHGSFIKKLTEVKAFISDHVRIRGRTRSVPNGLDERVNRTPSWKKNRHTVKPQQGNKTVTNLHEVAPNAYLNGHARNFHDHTTGSLPHLYPVSSTTFNGDHFQPVLPISDDDVDEWCTPYPSPTPPSGHFGSLDHFYKRKTTKAEAYRSVDNIKTRNRKSEKYLAAAASNNKTERKKDNETRNSNLYQFGSFSYSVVCSSSATDINKVNKNDQMDYLNSSSINKNGLIARSYSDAHVYNQNTDPNILPPMNNLLQTKQDQRISQEMSYNSLDRTKHHHKFKFEERKRKLPFSLSFKHGGTGKTDSSQYSLNKVPYQQKLSPLVGNSKVKIVATVSVDSNDEYKIRSKSKSNNTSPPSPKSPTTPLDNEAPIVVKLDSSIFDFAPLRRTLKTDVKTVDEIENKQEQLYLSLAHDSRKCSRNTDFAKRERTNVVFPENSNETNNNSQTESEKNNERKMSFWSDEEDERVFQLNNSSIRTIIESEARGVIGDEEYNEQKVTYWIKDICCNVRDKVRAYTGRHYKIVVNSFIGSRLPSNVDTVSMAMRGSRDADSERFIVCAFENESLFVSVTLLLIRTSVS